MLLSGALWCCLWQAWPSGALSANVLALSISLQANPTSPMPRLARHQTANCLRASVLWQEGWGRWLLLWPLWSTKWGHYRGNAAIAADHNLLMSNVYLGPMQLQLNCLYSLYSAARPCCWKSKKITPMNVTVGVCLIAIKNTFKMH